MKSKRFVVSVLSLMLGIGAFVGYAVEKARASGIPATQAMTYSGVLTDASGTPLTGSKNIQISIYDMATAGTLQCSAGPTALTLVGGGFQLALPDTCTTVVHGNPNLWIEVFADGASLGRTKLGAVPFAVEADHAKSADSAMGAAGTLAAQIVPAGAVVAFNLSACPTGWTPLAAAGGRTIVGVNGSGGNGLSQRNLGDTPGEESHTMVVSEMPAHAHDIYINGAGSGPNQGFWNLNWGNVGVAGSQAAIPPTLGGGLQNFMTVQPSGGGAAFTNMQPSLALLYCQKS